MDRFQEAIGWFEQSLDAGRMAHAYVIAGGPRDVGEFVDAAIKRMWRRDTGQDIDPRNNADILWVEPQKKSRTIGIDQVRAATHRMTHTSFGGGWKVCVIVDADRMGTGAANAFLKTLEEPPGQALFFLMTSQPESLLATILSRCQRIVLSSGSHELSPVWRSRVLEILSDESPDGVAAGMALSRRVISLLSEMKESLADQVAEAAAEGEDSAVVDARVSARYREARETVLRLLMTWHRDILLCTCGAGDDALSFSPYAETLRERASRVSYAVALRRIEAIEQMQKQLAEHLTEASAMGLGFGRLSM